VTPGEPILGVKVARLVRYESRIYFAPRFPRALSRPYEAVADAVCESEHRHAAPDPGCRCGFHAVATRDDLWRLDASPEAVILDVELAGTVIEHEYGWRAQHQVVLGVHLPAICAKWRCRRPTAGAAPCRPETYELEMSHWTLLRPTCTRCAKRRLVPIADLASELGVEVSAAPPPVRKPRWRRSHAA
jgi:hypothetical protein